MKIMKWGGIWKILSSTHFSESDKNPFLLRPKCFQHLLAISRVLCYLKCIYRSMCEWKTMCVFVYACVGVERERQNVSNYVYLSIIYYMDACLLICMILHDMHVYFCLWKKKKICQFVVSDYFKTSLTLKFLLAPTMCMIHSANPSNLLVKKGSRKQNPHFNCIPFYRNVHLVAILRCRMNLFDSRQQLKNSEQSK